MGYVFCSCRCKSHRIGDFPIDKCAESLQPLATLTLNNLRTFFRLSLFC